MFVRASQGTCRNKEFPLSSREKQQTIALRETLCLIIHHKSHDDIIYVQQLEVWGMGKLLLDW